MTLPDKFYDEFTLAVLISENGKVRAAAINSMVAWVSAHEIPHTRDPEGSDAVEAMTKAILEDSPEIEIILVEREGFPNKEPGIVRMLLGSNGQPINPRILNSESPSYARRAAADLLVFIAQKNDWPEVEAKLEEDRAKMGLPPLGPSN